jgi:thioredoxin reductase (NADPH)
MVDLIIIGAGPAGLTAAIYGARAGLNTLVIEKTFSGGQLAIIFEIDNYPGVPHTNGTELGLKMDEQARAVGAKIVNEEILEVSLEGEIKKVKTSANSYEAKSIILASGTTRRFLNCENEGKFFGMGVSYCAVCDGAFFRGKTVAVVGGGNTALEDAVYLTNLCEKVYLIHRRDEFRGEKHLQDLVLKNPKIEVILNTVVEKVDGAESLEKVVLTNVLTKEKSILIISGLFVAVGSIPETSFLKGAVTLTADGYIVTNGDLETSVSGVFGAGDVIEKKVRQIVTACADGAIASRGVSDYLNRD